MLNANDTLPFALAIAQARDLAAFKAAASNAADAVGAVSFNATCIPAAGRSTSAVFDVSAVPLTYQRTYSDMADAPVDPVMNHLRGSSVPIFWDASTYDGTHQRLYAPMADCGMQQGADVALHLGPDRHFVFGYTWRAGKATAEQRAGLLAFVQTLAVFAEPVARGLSLARVGVIAPKVPLTARELECLYWVSQGLTDDLVGSVVGISHRTVRKHVDSAILKLGAANRVEAAVRATRLGLLSEPPARAFD